MVGRPEVAVPAEFRAVVAGQLRMAVLAAIRATAAVGRLQVAVLGGFRAVPARFRAVAVVRLRLAVRLEAGFPAEPRLQSGLVQIPPTGGCSIPLQPRGIVLPHRVP